MNNYISNFQDEVINKCCEGKQKNPDCATSQHFKNGTFNKEIEDIMKRINRMVRGHVIKQPKKPHWVDFQKVIYNFGIAKLFVWLTKRQNGQYKIQLHRSWMDDNDKWHDDTININEVEDWEDIKKTIDVDYAKYLNWISKEEALMKLEKVPTEKTVKEIVDKRPKLIIDFLKNIDLQKFDLKQLSIFLDALSERDKDAIEREINLFNEMIKNLNPHDNKSIDDFLEIMDKVTFHGVNSTMRFVLDRQEKINIFQKMVNNDKTYEIRGENSIHKFLEKNIWILDEDYMILSSNQSLKIEIGKEYKKKHKISQSAKRPDFVLRTYKDDLIISEIKRPDYIVKLEDLFQLMEYRSIANELTGKDFNFSGYLIGKKFAPSVKAYTKDLPNLRIFLKSYTDVITEVRNRYKRLLEIVEEELKE